MATNSLDDLKLHVKTKLSVLWVSVVLCYIYGDYFGLYVPGTLQSMIDGKMGPLGATTQGVLLFTSAMMAIPSLMVFLSLAMPAKISRWLNIIFGSVYTIIMLLSMFGAWNFYIFFGIIEVALTLLIVWSAWHWPKQSPATLSHINSSIT